MPPHPGGGVADPLAPHLPRLAALVRHLPWLRAPHGPTPRALVRHGLADDHGPTPLARAMLADLDDRTDEWRALAEAALEPEWGDLRLRLDLDYHAADDDFALRKLHDLSFEIAPDESYEVLWGRVLTAARDTPDQLPRARAPVELAWRLDRAALLERTWVGERVVRQLQAHLKAGRNVALFGPPDTGKAVLAEAVAEQLGGVSAVTAEADWQNADMLGGPQPNKAGGVSFRDGHVTAAARRCEETVARDGKPLLLVIRHFNRADMDLAFGRLFTVFEYRDLLPLLTTRENRGHPFLMPPEFRLIVTVDTYGDLATQPLGFALRRRFAFVPLTLPSPNEERVWLTGPWAKREGLEPDRVTTALEALEPLLGRGTAEQPGLRRHYPLGTPRFAEAVTAVAAGADREMAMEQALAPVAGLLPRRHRQALAATAREVLGDGRVAKLLTPTARPSIEEALAEVEWDAW